jgi:hypothetical protein
MKRALLIAAVLVLAASVQAQRVPVRATDHVSPAAAASMQQTAPRPAQTLPQDVIYLPGSRKATIKRLAKTTNATEQVGLMANTYAVMGENRTQIACDPKTGTVAVTYRGNDRGSSSAGNTIYVRYSTDNGATWGAQGDNLANTSGPRYPNIYLSNSTGSSNPADVRSVLSWGQTVNYGNGTNGFGELDFMRANIGNSNAQFFSLPRTNNNWGIPFEVVQDQSTGDLYSIALPYNASDATWLNRYDLIKSTDGGLNWTVTGTPPYLDTDIPEGFFQSSAHLDISPSGRMLFSYGLIAETSVGSGSAYLTDPNHGFAYRTSDDKGQTWTDPIQVIPSTDIDAGNMPSAFSTGVKMAWDFDGMLDSHNEPHFLMVASNDINPFGISSDPIVINDTPYLNLANVDSTFLVEMTKINGTWKMIPVGPVRRVRTDRLSFTSASSTSAAYVFRAEPRWARTWDGTRMFAKWTTPRLSWFIATVDGQRTLFQDTLHNIYVNGLIVDDRSTNQGWVYPWDYAVPGNNVENTNPMRVTDLDVEAESAVMAKFTKVARLVNEVGNEYQMHLVYTEWAYGERPDDDAILADNILWYVKDVKLPKVAIPLGVEQISSTPGTFTLTQNFPNPFNPSTSIDFTLPKSGLTSLKVYNMLGQVVATLADGVFAAGSHRATFDAHGLPSGMYIYRLESGSFSTAKKMMLTK